MKTFSYLWQYLAEFFLEWEMLYANVETRNTDFNNFFPKI